MSSANPYIEGEEIRRPTQSYELTVVVEETGERRTIIVDPAALPYSHDGEPGSILDVLLGAGIELDHACGGVCACSTCHVIVREGLETANESTEDEEDQLDNAPALTPQSRLGCQCVPDGSKPVTVEIPRWNRNNAREGD